MSKKKAGLLQSRGPARSQVGRGASDALLSDDDLTRWMEAAAEKNVNVVLLVDGCHGAILSLGEVVDGYLWADVCTNNHRVDRHAVARRWREAQPMTLAEAAEIIGVPWPTLRRWASRGLIRSVGETRWKAPLYRLAEIRRAAQLAGRTA